MPDVDQHEIHDLIETESANEKERTLGWSFNVAALCNAKQNVGESSHVDDKGEKSQSNGEPYFGGFASDDGFFVAIDFIAVILEEHLVGFVGADGRNSRENFREAADNRALGDSFDSGELFAGF